VYIILKKYNRGLQRSNTIGAFIEMQIFYEQDLSNLFQEGLRQMEVEVLGEDKNQLLNCNEVEYIECLLSKYSIEPLDFDWESKYATDYEAGIPINDYFDDYGREKTISRQIITYHIPYKGNSNILSFRPSSSIIWSTDIKVDTNMSEISFDIVNQSDEPEQIQRDANHTIDSIQRQLANVMKDIEQYNARLESKIVTIVKSRKAELLKQSDLLGSLGVPIKKSPNVPDTFAIQAPKKKTIIKKPTAPNTSFKPEPTLDSSTYNEILKICYHTGVEIERHPTIYKDKDEETLRDYFLMVLSPHFQSVTGETFNKGGKTDILIRHEGKNVFIAECKFWKGIKSYHKTIDQLLGYLTFRDSKAAILCFIKNKELTPVLEQVEAGTSMHSCFVKGYEKTTESQFHFNLHLKKDSTRGVELAVLCFHFSD